MFILIFPCSKPLIIVYAYKDEQGNEYAMKVISDSFNHDYAAGLIARECYIYSNAVKGMLYITRS